MQALLLALSCANWYTLIGCNKADDGGQQSMLPIEVGRSSVTHNLCQSAVTAGWEFEA